MSSEMTMALERVVRGGERVLLMGRDAEIRLAMEACVDIAKKALAAPRAGELAVAAGYHSPQFIVMFLGYMTAKLQLKVTEQQLLDLFTEFEETAAKR